MWFEPREVWEIRGADLSLSPVSRDAALPATAMPLSSCELHPVPPPSLAQVHKAAEGLVHAERGLGLRFPRFLGRVRQDKSPEDATSSQQIAEMYRAQVRAVGADTGDWCQNSTSACRLLLLPAACADTQGRDRRAAPGG